MYRFLILFFLFSFSLSAQPFLLKDFEKAKLSSAVAPSDVAVGLMASSFFDSLLNNYRLSKKLPEVQFNRALWLAAINHNLWMAATGTFSHVQVKNHDYFSGVSHGDRIRFVSHNAMSCFGSAENIVSLNLPQLNNDALVALRIAQQAFDLWKNSPGHNRNMTHANYNQHGMAFFISNNKVWGCSVFGACGVSDSTLLLPLAGLFLNTLPKLILQDSFSFQMAHLETSKTSLSRRSELLRVFSDDSTLGAWSLKGTPAMRKTVRKTASYAAYHFTNNPEQVANSPKFYARNTRNQLLKASGYTRIFARNRRYHERIFLLQSPASHTCSSEVLYFINEHKKELAEQTVVSSHVHVYKKNNLFYTAWTVLVV